MEGIPITDTDFCLTKAFKIVISPKYLFAH